MTALLATEFTRAPLATTSGQFALTGHNSGPVSSAVPSRVGVRPWGLRQLVVPALPAAVAAVTSYCPERQVRVNADGCPLLDVPTMADPTANTTSSTDGEDPPSSEDWTNDFAPDEPGMPA